MPVSCFLENTEATLTLPIEASEAMLAASEGSCDISSVGNLTISTILVESAINSLTTDSNISHFQPPVVSKTQKLQLVYRLQLSSPTNTWWPGRALSDCTGPASAITSAVRKRFTGIFVLCSPSSLLLRVPPAVDLCQSLLRASDAAPDGSGWVRKYIRKTSNHDITLLSRVLTYLTCRAYRQQCPFRGTKSSAAERSAPPC